MRVIKGHVRSFESAPAVKKGESVIFIRVDSKNPDWFFGADQAGVEGYFPLSWFKIDRRRGRAEALRDYDASELTLPEEVVIGSLETYGGWVFVEFNGQRGWIPHSCFEDKEAL